MGKIKEYYHNEINGNISDENFINEMLDEEYRMYLKENF